MSSIVHHSLPTCHFRTGLRTTEHGAQNTRHRLCILLYTPNTPQYRLFATHHPGWTLTIGCDADCSTRPKYLLGRKIGPNSSPVHVLYMYVLNVRYYFRTPKPSANDGAREDRCLVSTTVRLNRHPPSSTLMQPESSSLPQDPPRLRETEQTDRRNALSTRQTSTCSVRLSRVLVLMLPPPVLAAYGRSCKYLSSTRRELSKRFKYHNTLYNTV